MFSSMHGLGLRAPASTVPHAHAPSAFRSRAVLLRPRVSMAAQQTNGRQAQNTQVPPIIINPPAAPSNKELADEVKHLKGEVQSGMAQMQRLAQIQIYQWAVNNSNQGSFTYTYEDDDGDTWNLHSSALVAEIILQAFMRGCGRWLFDDYYYVGSTTKEGQVAFRERLSAQIHVLTGQKPRITWEYNKNVGRHMHCMYAS